jgi:glycosyltransferase involved in cell wall biosynthesis
MRGDAQRVLMTADTIGGVWTYALDLVRSLAPHGIEFALATMGEPLSAAQREQVRRLKNVSVFESRFKLEWMDDPWTDVERAGEWLLTIENEVEPDIVHLNGYAHGSLPWHEPHMIVGHSCVLSWWRAVKREMAPGKWTAYRSAVSRGLRSADLVAAPTHAMMSELQALYGPLSNTAVIPNGRSPEAYARGSKRPFIIAAGRLWDEAKNISALDAAAERLAWPVFVAGDPRHPNGSTFLPRSVRLLGKLAEDELGAHLAAASIYALPARYEPFGLSVVEAALSRCALVLGDIPSLRENWDGAAIFVPPDDTASLESALLELIGCERRRNSVAAAAYERARNFTPQKMAAGYLCAYRQLLDIATPHIAAVH